MLSYKDTIELLHPVTARITLNFTAPFTDIKDVSLEPGTVLQISPLHQLQDNIVFRCPHEHKLAFISRYLIANEVSDEAYAGLHVTINKNDLINNYTVPEKANLDELDLTCPEDQSVFVLLHLNNEEKLNELPGQLRALLKAKKKTFDDVSITRNELTNQCIEILRNYYNQLPFHLEKILKSLNAYVLDGSEDNPREAAEKIHNLKPEVIVLNIEGNFGGSKRQEQKGVEILMWLRCKYRMCTPVILYSYQSSHQLLKQKPENLIISSEGCYFFQLPYDFKKLQRTYEGVKDENSLKKFLKPAFSIEEFRHKEANWWGIKCLWDVHTVYNNLTKDKTTYPAKVRDEYNKLLSAVGEFIYGSSGDELKEKLEWQHDRLSSNNLTNRNKIEELRQSIHNPKILLVDDMAADGWIEIFINMVYKQPLTFTREDNYSISYGINKSELYLTALKVKSFKDKDELIVHFFEDDTEIISKDWDLLVLDLQLYPETEKDLRNVDDLSGVAVLDFIRNEKLGLPVLITTASNKIWSYREIIKHGADAYWIKEGIDERKGGIETVFNYINFLSLIQKLTGYRYNAFKRIGVMIAEINNRTDLWWKQEVDWCKIGSEFNMDTFNVPKKTNINPQTVLSILNDSFLLLRDYLQKTELHNIFDPFHQKDWVMPSLIIQHLAKIVEVIHDFDNYENNTNTFRRCLNNGLIDGFFYLKNDDKAIKNFNSKVSCIELKRNGPKASKWFIPIRNDQKGSDLFDERNRASHTSDLTNINFKTLKVFFDNILKYLVDVPDKKGLKMFSKQLNSLASQSSNTHKSNTKNIQQKKWR